MIREIDDGRERRLNEIRREAEALGRVEAVGAPRRVADASGDP
jgi:hypothetical protein